MKLRRYKKAMRRLVIRSNDHRQTLENPKNRPEAFRAPGRMKP